MELSIIIPSLNEAKHLPSLLNSLCNWQTKLQKEIIVVDGGSTDETELAAAAFEVHFYRSKRGRANQLNFGATKAKGAYLLFIHADSLLSEKGLACISAFIEKGHAFGNFSLQFDREHWFLKLNAWFSRLSLTAFQYGDQALLVKADLFLQEGGYPEKYKLFEDQEIIRKLKRKANLVKMEASLITSARRYQKVGIYKLQFAYFLLYFFYRLGWSQRKLNGLYQKLIAEPH
jgi:rSAM/selenodomain-associated transferase 2